jgi:hypothetical protein
MSSYTLTVTLAHIRPKIWRQLRVPGHFTLGQLHDVLQVAFEWQDRHLHDFEVGAQHYGACHPDDERELSDEDDFTVAQALPHKSSTIRYIYDLGDAWIHNITVDDIEDEPPTHRARSLSSRGPTSSVACLAGARAAPPESCGGPFAYLEFVEAISSPAHPRHDELLEWIGGMFDPEEFSLREINEGLARFRD